jgi:hypothetical protein
MFDRFPTPFANIPDFKARPVWVSVAETSRGIDEGEVSSGRNAAD